MAFGGGTGLPPAHISIALEFQVGEIVFSFNFFYFMRLLLIVQLILHDNITDIYKSDYN